MGAGKRKATSASVNVSAARSWGTSHASTTMTRSTQPEALMRKKQESQQGGSRNDGAPQPFPCSTRTGAYSITLGRLITDCAGG